MKRHPALEPFSRDHNGGLFAARKLSQGLAPEEALLEFAELWREEMKDHFDEEERLLGRLCLPGELERLIDEHKRIGALAENGTPAQATTLGKLLNDHIRWEERSLFPAIESRATPEDFDWLERETEALEDRRAELPRNARRAELVKRRRSDG
jgi:hemerythrin-like domain-containing protein